MTDRQTSNPGQYKAVITSAELAKLQAGEEFTLQLTRDDHPLTEGTPYNKESVLPDELAVVLCPDIPDPTPADAFAALNARAAFESSEHPGCYYRVVDGEEEWINPPMVYGVEYRTAERSDGKPLYTKIYSATLDSEQVTIPLDYPSVRKWSGFTSQPSLLPNNNPNSKWNIVVRIADGYIILFCGSSVASFGGTKAFIQVWYTK